MQPGLSRNSPRPATHLGLEQHGQLGVHRASDSLRILSTRSKYAPRSTPRRRCAAAHLHLHAGSRARALRSDGLSRHHQALRARAQLLEGARAASASDAREARQQPFHRHGAPAFELHRHPPRCRASRRSRRRPIWWPTTARWCFACAPKAWDGIADLNNPGVAQLYLERIRCRVERERSGADFACCAARLTRPARYNLRSMTLKPEVTVAAVTQVEGVSSASRSASRRSWCSISRRATWRSARPCFEAVVREVR